MGHVAWGKRGGRGRERGEESGCRKALVEAKCECAHLAQDGHDVVLLHVGAGDHGVGRRHVLRVGVCGCGWMCVGRRLRVELEAVKGQGGRGRDRWVRFAPWRGACRGGSRASSGRSWARASCRGREAWAAPRPVVGVAREERQRRVEERSLRAYITLTMRKTESPTTPVRAAMKALTLTKLATKRRTCIVEQLCCTTASFEK